MEHCLTDSNENDAEVKKAVIAASHRKILAVDHSKFDIVSFVSIAGFDDIDLVVTDARPNDEWCKFFAESKIELIY